MALTLRSSPDAYVGRFSLDQLLADTAAINEQIKDVIDKHTEPWGTQVTAVEIKDIVLPENMQRAMAKEAEAERERRAKIVAADKPRDLKQLAATAGIAWNGRKPTGLKRAVALSRGKSISKIVVEDRR